MPATRTVPRRSFVSPDAVLGTRSVVMIALAGVLALPVVLNYLPLPGSFGILTNIARWPVLLALVAVLIAVAYRYGPSRAAPRWQWVTWGSALAAVGWFVVSALFSFYAANFGSFNKTYGSLGAVIGFMMWIWLSVIVVLIGAKLNAETEKHQTARESTTGQEKPLGRRGARMADTVGTAHR